MSIDLSPAIAAEMQINRLYLTDSATLVFEKADADLGYVPVLTLDGASDWDAQDVENIQNNKEFYSIRVLDFTGLEDKINQSAMVKLEGYRYKIERVFPPKGATRVWTLRCSRTGERVV